MSTQSGITGSPELLQAFQTNQDEVLVIKVSTDSTQLVPDPDFPKVTGTLDNKFNQLHQYISKIYPQPVYILIPIGDNGHGNEYSFISFIPDVAHIRDKMLYASTKNTLLQELGGNKIKKDHYFNWSEVNELTLDHYNDCIPSNNSPNNEGPLTQEEKYMKQINSLQDYSSVENPSFSKKLASMDNSSTQLLFKIDDDLEKQFETLKDDHKLILFNIDLSKELFQLMKTFENIQLDHLISTLESFNTNEPIPKFAIYNYLPSKYALIYTCPSGSKVKDRMIYASNKQGLINHLKSLFSNRDLQLDKVLDIGDIDELEINSLKPQDSASESSAGTKTGLKFNKPKGPRRR